MITNIKKEDYDAVAGVNWPSYEDYVRGDPINQTIQIEIDKFVKNTQSIYSEGYNYLSKEPFYIKKTDLTVKQYNRLVQSKTFCMLPWVHMHAFPDGRAYPCCMSDYWHSVGDLRKNTMEEVWNQQPYRTLRINMLDEQPSKECKRCYEQEENGFFSLRNDANRNYGHHIIEVEQTQEDGTHPEFKIRYWDIRFSNLCNFSCRSCGPIFSSNWFNDHVKLHDRKPDVLGREMLRVEYTAGDEDAMMEQMLPHIPYLEQVYFAGGEPLIMKEHYFLLEKLIEHGKTDIRIQYNTNFSELRYKDKHVFDYWKHFKNVSVGASLDASGARAELMRKGTNWKQVVENRKRMIKEVPHVDFYVSATVSAMNVLHVLDFHKEWVELDLIKAKDFNVNLCQSPAWYRPNIFPQWFKEQAIIPKYIKHLDWLEPLDSLQRATNGYKSLLNFISTTNAEVEIYKFDYESFKGEDWPSWKDFLEGTRTKNSIINDEIEEFIKLTKQVNEFKEFKIQVEKLDAIRNENFWKVFPELNELA
jgi:radical SAM protein with 4Fe4S-binding SPASM domain